MKEKILYDAKKGGGDTTNTSNETTSATNNSSNETTCATNTVTTISNDTYVYGVGIDTVLVIGVCVFLHIRLKIKKPSTKKNKINHQKDVICFRKNIH